MNRTSQLVAVAVSNAIDKALVLDNALAKELSDTSVSIKQVSHMVSEGFERFLVEVQNGAEVTNLYVDVCVKPCQ